MPLGDITGSEVNLPKNTPFKRTRFQQIDDDNTFLPPSLSSYARELLKETKPSVTSPVTGIYNIDFPSNSTLLLLKNKLSLHFNLATTSPNSKIPIHLDSKTHSRETINSNLVTNMLPSTKESIKNNSLSNDHSYQTNSDYLDDIMNTNGSAHSNSSFRSLLTSATTAAGETSTNSRSLSEGLPQVHTLKKMRGSRRFGNLGPPKRGISSSEQTHSDLSTPPPPQFAPEGLLPHSDSRHLDLSVSSDDSKEKLQQKRMEFELGQAYLENEKIEENLIKVDKVPMTVSPDFRGDIQEAFRKPKIPRPLEPQGQIIYNQNQNQINSKINSQALTQSQSQIHYNQINHNQKFSNHGYPSRVNNPLNGAINPQHNHVNNNQANNAINSQINQNFPKYYPQLNGQANNQTPIIARTKPHPIHPTSASSHDDIVKKKKLITINDVQYEKLELLGRGGSSKVYKVKAITNNKIYAIKKVTFDQFDESCVRGFKGEIDLLLKLREYDRVVRLVDHAIGEGSIYLVMECGETDLAHVFQTRLSAGQKMDINFVKFYSIELFKCVLAVHDGGIVHSDLKPANFLLVRGILKIIDFGIANAVPDHTVNIYRESQIGTPNYMAPEALIEASQLPGMPANHFQQKNTWRVGKPSDVWSCGCIIYQMLYGKPPYGSYSGNQRLMAIINPQVRITYPSTGLGGIKVPKSAIDLIQKCLARNPDDRPSVEECLKSDFLEPKIVNEDFIRDIVHLAVNFGINNRAGGSGIITADIYDRLVETVMAQIDELNYG